MSENAERDAVVKFLLHCAKVETSLGENQKAWSLMHAANEIGQGYHLADPSKWPQPTMPKRSKE